jgi:hypothetical protein
MSTESTGVYDKKSTVLYIWHRQGKEQGDVCSLNKLPLFERSVQVVNKIQIIKENT